MTQYNSLNVKLSNSQFNKFKSAIKNETEVVLSFSFSFPDISNLATKTALTTVENEISDINNMATKTAIPDISSVVKKTNYNAKISSLNGKIYRINFDTKKC